MISVLIVDDQTLVRQGIRSLLELAPDIKVVGEASDGEEALALVKRVKADVMLLDVRMPKLNGLQVLEALKGSPSSPAALLLTTFDDDSVALQGLKAGARGFLLKDVTLEQLTEAIRDLAAGKTLIRPSVTERVVRAVGQTERTFEASELPDPLTPRETEILRLLAAGSSNKEIAQALGTAEGTVKNQVSSIMSKLGVRDRTRAVLRGLELGLL